VTRWFVAPTSFSCDRKLLTAPQSDTQKRITATEHKLDATETLSSELHTLTGNMEEKKTRLEKLKNDMKSENYEGKLAEKAAKARNMEDQRSALNSDLRSLSLQADSRARFDLKRIEFKTKTADVKNTCVPCAFL
jgi:DNA repair protein RAD50